jgi:hypothetical protein
LIGDAVMKNYLRLLIGNSLLLVLGIASAAPAKEIELDFSAPNTSYEVAPLRANFLSPRFPSFKKPPQLSKLLRLNATRYQWWSRLR